MLLRLFSFLNQVPAARRWIWRHWYRYLSRRFHDGDWSFMNYGLVPDPGAPALALRPEDEPDRTWIALYQQVVAAVDLTGAAVLEVGSGRGGGASFIKRYRGPATMLGLDISDSAVALCRQRHRIDGLSFQQGDAEAMPIESATMDAVVNVESSHCYGSLPTFLAEVRRVLRPGGHFLYADFRASADIPAWLDDIRAAGFIEQERQDITAAVVRAIERDQEQRAQLIERSIPKALLPTFRQFAGVPGSLIHEGLCARQLIYLRFVLQSPASDRAANRTQI
jgi:ubiquinone/menaquinone biosynthesis C-methylase UbiE